MWICSNYSLQLVLAKSDYGCKSQAAQSLRTRRCSHITMGRSQPAICDGHSQAISVSDLPRRHAAGFFRYKICSAQLRSAPLTCSRQSVSLESCSRESWFGPSSLGHQMRLQSSRFTRQVLSTVQRVVFLMGISMMIIWEM